MRHLRGATTYLALFCAISCFLKHCFFNLVEIGMSSLETWKLTYDLISCLKFQPLQAACRYNRLLWQVEHAGNKKMKINTKI